MSTTATAPTQQKITTFLWFDNQAEEAMNFYVSTFKNSRVLSCSHYGEGMPQPKGTVLVGTFELDGQQFQALNGGPQFKFTEAISLSVACDSQQEIDELWEKLTANGGQESQCGWLKDKYGLSWQIVPRQIGEWLTGNPEKANRVLQAIMPMKKLDMKKLEDAYNGTA